MAGFNDGSAVYVVAEPDEQPKSGTWAPSPANASKLSPEEIERGNALGESIDVDDDEDNGGVPREKG